MLTTLIRISHILVYAPNDSFTCVIRIIHAIYYKMGLHNLMSYLIILKYIWEMAFLLFTKPPVEG
ncbi:hypothetical protein AM461_11330 [Providencia rettgeri]|nr:hypothetical protein AM461_11330 [Providencia rettgeri]